MTGYGQGGYGAGPYGGEPPPDPATKTQVTILRGGGGTQQGTYPATYQATY